MNSKDLQKEDMRTNAVNGFYRLNHHGELQIKFRPNIK